MKFPLALALPVLAAAAEYTTEDYESGKVHMESMARKEAKWAEQRAAGKHDSSQWKSWKNLPKTGNWKQTRTKVPCANGFATVEKGNPDQTFACDRVSHTDSVP